MTQDVPRWQQRANIIKQRNITRSEAEGLSWDVLRQILSFIDFPLNLYLNIQHSYRNKDT